MDIWGRTYQVEEGSAPGARVERTREKGSEEQWGLILCATLPAVIKTEASL